MRFSGKRLFEHAAFRANAFRQPISRSTFLARGGAANTTPELWLIIAMAADCLELENPQKWNIAYRTAPARTAATTLRTASGRGGALRRSAKSRCAAPTRV